jgi:hypothetical protein
MTAPTVTRTRSYAVTAITVTFDRVGPVRSRRAKPIAIAPMVLRIPPHTAKDAKAIAGFIAPMIAIHVGNVARLSRPTLRIDIDTTGTGSILIDGGVNGSATIAPTNR